MLIDTDVLSFVFKESPIREQYRPHLDGRALLVSFQSVAEMDRWPLERAWGERRRRQLEAFLSGLTEVGHSRALSRRWAVVMSASRRAGKPITGQDAWVAATALEIGVPLVTHNARHFAAVRGLEVITAAEHPDDLSR